ncbi:auxin efflux carrier [Phellopilus nigrolimitatus]|nr:auxin efflux carrier [Phellopilus nigrolimitatus]
MQMSIGALIWLSVRPLISRLWLSAAFGFAITKADIFPLAASRGAGQIVLNVTLPCLMFSKIVPAFTPQNIDSLAVLVTLAFIYEALGFLLALGVKQFCWVPHRFRYGILCAGTISNYSDIPTAVITSITANLPFNAATDQTISVAYIAGFILIFFISLFPGGAYRLVEMDYVGPNVEDEDLRISMMKKTKQSMQDLVTVMRAIPILGKKKPLEVSSTDLEKLPSSTEKSTQERTDDTSKIDESVQPASEPPYSDIGSDSPIREVSDKLTDIAEQRRTGYTLAGRSVHFNSFPDESTAVPTDAGPSCMASRAPSTAVSVHREELSTADLSPTAAREDSEETPRPVVCPSLPAGRPPFKKRALMVARSVMRSFLLPCSVTIVFSIVISVVTPLKALFTPVPNSPIPNAPDGQPPLAFILDCATFVGAASVPLGLICLGAAVARVNLPRRGEWGMLPLGAIIWFAITKMLLLPVLGVLICQGLVQVGFIDADDKVLRFVCMFMSVVPTATSQVYLTQVYSGTGEAGVLPLFLVPQYILMFFSMTILIAYSLSILF